MQIVKDNSEISRTMVVNQAYPLAQCNPNYKVFMNNKTNIQTYRNLQEGLSNWPPCDFL